MIIYFAVFLVLFAGQIPITPPTRTNHVSFQHEILPVLQANCLPCHNQTRAKGDLILETPTTMLKGGSSGSALIAGKPTESRMLQVAAHQIDDLIMPPQGNKVNARDLTPQELGMLALWIEQGAEADAAESVAIGWKTIPTNWVSSFAVALTPDGHSVAVARANRVFLYDSQSGKPEGELCDSELGGVAQRDWVSSLAFSPNGQTLAAAGFREVRFWEQSLLKTAKIMSGSNWIAAAFSEDRGRIALMTSDDRLEIRRLSDGEVTFSREMDTKQPISLKWAHDEKSIALANADGTLQIVPLNGSNTELQSFSVSQIAFDPTPKIEERFCGDPRISQKIAALEDELALSRSELSRGETLVSEAESAIKTGDENLKKAREKREGHLKALAEKEKELKQQQDNEASATKERDQIATELQKKTEEVKEAEKALEQARAAAVSANEEEREARLADAIVRAVATGEKKAENARAQADLPPRKKQAEERITAAQKAVKDLQPQVHKARIALDGSTQDTTLVETAIGRGKAALAEAKNGIDIARKRISVTETELKVARSDLSRTQNIATIGSNISSNVLLTISAEGLATEWDTNTASAKVALDLQGKVPLTIAKVNDHEFMAAFSDSVVSVDTARAWLLKRTIGSNNEFVDRVNALAFSPDGTLLATGGGDPSRTGELKLWRVADGGLVRDFGGIHSDCVMALAFSPRGEWLATGGADRFARITPVVGDGPRLNLEGHTQHVLDVAWLADGGTLATAGAEGVVKLWNPKNGERRKNVEGFGKEVTGLKSVGATNQFLAISGSGQGRIFRSDGEKVRELATVSTFIQTCAIARNGNVIAGAGDDGILRIWDAQSGKERLQIPVEQPVIP